MSRGFHTACCKSVSEAVAPTAKTTHAEVEASPVFHADTTGRRYGEDRIELWVAAAAETKAFRLHPGRGYAQAKRTRPIQTEMREQFEILAKNPDTNQKAQGTTVMKDRV